MNCSHNDLSPSSTHGGDVSKYCPDLDTYSERVHAVDTLPEPTKKVDFQAYKLVVRSRRWRDEVQFTPLQAGSLYPLALHFHYQPIVRGLNAGGQGLGRSFMVQVVGHVGNERAAGAQALKFGYALC